VRTREAIPFGCVNSPFSTPDLRALLNMESNCVSEANWTLLLALTYFLIAWRLVRLSESAGCVQLTHQYQIGRAGQRAYLLPFRSLSYEPRHVSRGLRCQTRRCVVVGNGGEGRVGAWSQPRQPHMSQMASTHIEDSFLDHV
jgi:hypothetical protein